MSMLLRRHYKTKESVKPQASPAIKEDFPKHTGGGWYELSNGEKVQGKDEAKDKQLEVGE